MKKIKIIFILLTIVFIAPISAQAQQDSGYSYQFHLYLANGTLTYDPSYKTPYDLVAKSYAKSSGTAYADIFSASGKLLASIPCTIADGANAIEAPYFPNAGKIVFHAALSSVEPMTLSLAASAVCNENSICEQAIGENANNCPHDCSAATAAQTAFPTTSQAGALRSPQNNVLWLSILAVFFLATVGIGIFLVIKVRSRANDQ